MPCSWFGSGTLLRRVRGDCGSTCWPSAPAVARRPAVPRVHRPLVARRDHHDAPHPLWLPDPRRAADPRQRPRGRGHDLGGVQLRAARDARAGARGARPSGRLPDRRPPGRPAAVPSALFNVDQVHAVARRRRADGRGADGPASRAPATCRSPGRSMGLADGRRGVLRGQQRARGHGIRARAHGAARSASTCARHSPSRP